MSSWVQPRLGHLRNGTNLLQTTSPLSGSLRPSWHVEKRPRPLRHDSELRRNSCAREVGPGHHQPAQIRPGPTASLKSSSVRLRRTSRVLKDKRMVPFGRDGTSFAGSLLGHSASARPADSGESEPSQLLTDTLEAQTSEPADGPDGSDL